MNLTRSGRAPRAVTGSLPRDLRRPRPGRRRRCSGETPRSRPSGSGSRRSRPVRFRSHACGAPFTLQYKVHCYTKNGQAVFSCGGAVAMKRFVDVIGAIGGLVVFALPMALVAVVILLADGPPVLFRQERLGRQRRLFTILKFRS